MIAPSYAKKILNALFHTEGSVGKTAEQEKEELKSEGVKWQTVTETINGEEQEVIYGYTADDYASAWALNGYEKNGTVEQVYNQYKEKVNKCSWYRAVNTASKRITLKDQDGKEHTDTFTGWKIVERSEQVNSYPQTSFLALFTTMPDSEGAGYVEPQIEGDDATNYMRVNLHEGIITGENALKMAEKDEETGESVIANQEIIAFPEVEGVDWGEIVGFGVFETEEVSPNDTPIFWGSLSNDGGKINAVTNRVPLFRVNNFKITLQ